MTEITPSFDEIPVRMKRLGLSRAWLAEQCDYTTGTIAAILAPNGSERHKTTKALRRMGEALDREEERQRRESATPAFERQQLVLRPTDEEFEAWSRAAAGRPVNLWAVDTLNERAAKISARQRLRVARGGGAEMDEAVGN